VVAQGQVRDRSDVGAAPGPAGVMPATELLSHCAETPHGAFRPDARFVADAITRSDRVKNAKRSPNK